MAPAEEKQPPTPPGLSAASKRTRAAAAAADPSSKRIKREEEYEGAMVANKNVGSKAAATARPVPAAPFPAIPATDEGKKAMSEEAKKAAARAAALAPSKSKSKRGVTLATLAAYAPSSAAAATKKVAVAAPAAVRSSPGQDDDDNDDEASSAAASGAASGTTSAAVSDNAASAGRVRGGRKANKGLRHFSLKVCRKVEEKGHTTYNEVADELVKEYMDAQRAEMGQPPLEEEDAAAKKKKAGGGRTKAPAKGYDEKNIRRRVYDALNVLMAMDIIKKEKKEITWKGLPSVGASLDLDALRREKSRRLREVAKKRECLQELLVQNVCFRNLLRRNRDREEVRAVSGGGGGMGGAGGFGGGVGSGGRSKPLPPPPSHPLSTSSPSKDAASKEGEERIPLPFIIVNTSSQAVIQCEMCPDRTDVMFDFSLPFEINDDNEILKRLGLNKTTENDLRIMLPNDLLMYCREHNLLDSVVVPPHMMPKWDTPAWSQHPGSAGSGPSRGGGAPGGGQHRPPSSSVPRQQQQQQPPQQHPRQRPPAHQSRDDQAPLPSAPLPHPGAPPPAGGGYHPQQSHRQRQQQQQQYYAPPPPQGSHPHGGMTRSHPHHLTHQPSHPHLRASGDLPPRM